MGQEWVLEVRMRGGERKKARDLPRDVDETPSQGARRGAGTSVGGWDGAGLNVGRWGGAGVSVEGGVLQERVLKVEWGRVSVEQWGGVRDTGRGGLGRVYGRYCPGGGERCVGVQPRAWTTEQGGKRISHGLEFPLIHSSPHTCHVSHPLSPLSHTPHFPTLSSHLGRLHKVVGEPVGVVHHQAAETDVHRRFSPFQERLQVLWQRTCGREVCEGGRCGDHYFLQ